MASVFKELVLTWGGKEYRTKPTFAMIQGIESQDISLSHIAYMLAQGRPPFSHIATVISVLLNAAGARADAEQVYSEITEMEYGELRKMIEAILLAAFPQAGKVEAPATTKPKRNRR